MTLLCALFVLSAAPRVDLVVHATGFTDAGGHAIAKLFLPGQNVRGKGQVEVRAEIHHGEATLTFPALEPGDYAVVVFHDLNDNAELDHGLFGPKEPIGFSNGFELRLTSGLPTFDKLKFPVTAERSRIEVTVK